MYQPEGVDTDSIGHLAVQKTQFFICGRVSVHLWRSSAFSPDLSCTAEQTVKPLICTCIMKHSPLSGQRQTNMHWILVHHRHDSSPCFWTHSSQEVYGYWAKERFAAIFCSRAAQPQPFFFCVQMVFVFFPCCKVFVVWIFSYCFQCAVNTFHSFRVFSGETSTLLPFKTFSYGEMVK